MEKTFIALLVFIIVFVGLATYGVFSMYETREELRDLCTEMGGITIVGDKGHFKVCLRSEAVIQLND
jgi:hypothetical protein